MKHHQQINIIAIPKDLYAHKNAEEQLSAEQSTRTPVVKLSWDKGIFLYLKGAEYPQKGLTSAEAMWAVNMVKRNFIEAVKTFSMKTFLPAWLLFLFYRKKTKVAVLEKLLGSFNRQSWGIISPFVLKSDYLTPCAQEILWFSYSFLMNMGISADNADRFAVTIAHAVEYDNAYRYRIEDIFSETTKVKLMEDPKGEIKRLLKIMAERDSANVHAKFRMVVLGMAFMMLFFKKAFLTAINEIDVRKLALDEADRYWVCLRKDYKFLGKSYEERQEMLKGKSLPVFEKN